MKKLTMMFMLMLLSLVLASGMVFAEETVKFWYHFDDPETALNPLIEKFETENPGIYSGVDCVCVLKNICRVC